MSEIILSNQEVSPFPWQQEIWHRLMNYVQTDRLPHALIINGIEGIGKLNLALCFTNYLLCGGVKNAGLRCRHCTSCRLIDGGTHPDLIRIEPLESGKEITIDRIRALGDTLSLSPQYNQYRVVILNPADRLNTAAANALLKTLEEPSEKTVLILLTTRHWDLPATINSRCQRLNIPQPDRALASAWLEQRITISETEVLLALAGGGPLKALELSETGILAQRNALYSSWCELATKRSDPIRVVEKWSSSPLREVFFWIIGWTIDMIRLAMAPSVAILTNPDFRVSLQAEVEKLDLKQLFCFYDRLIQSGSSMNSPVNPQLLLENVLIDWFSLKRNL